jgi:hypothetical protein
MSLENSNFYEILLGSAILVPSIYYRHKYRHPQSTPEDAVSERIAEYPVGIIPHS